MIFDRFRKKRKRKGGGDSEQDAVNLAEGLSSIDDVLAEVDEALHEADRLLAASERSGVQEFMSRCGC